MAYSLITIPALQNMVSTATKPNWGGANGIQQMLNGLIGLEYSRGIMQVPSLSALALMSGADTSLALVIGKGIYLFNPGSVGTRPATTVRAVSGAWDLICVTPGVPYERVVGDAVTTTFTLVHNLDTLSPTVLVWDVLAAGINGYPRTLKSDYTLTVVDANTISITSTGVAPWGGNSRRIVVKSF